MFTEVGKTFKTKCILNYKTIRELDTVLIHKEITRVTLYLSLLKSMPKECDASPTINFLLFLVPFSKFR